MQLAFTTRFTATSGPVALAKVLEAVKVFSDGNTNTPIPGCVMIVNLTSMYLSDTLNLTANGFVSVAAAEAFEDNSDYFTFQPMDGNMVFRRRINHEEDVDAMGEAVFDLLCAQYYAK